MPSHTPPWYADRLKGSADKREFKIVYHVTHFREAVRILEDKTITGQLVPSRSRLSRSRVRVCWLMPNQYLDSHFGHFRLSLDWESLSDNASFYWIEHSSLPLGSAPRLLLVKDGWEPRNLRPYSPREDNGPLTLNGRTWYSSAQRRCDLLVAGDIHLSDCCKLDFVPHSKCQKFGANCPDKDQENTEAGSHLMASAVGNSMRSSRHVFLEVGGAKLHRSAGGAWGWVKEELKPKMGGGSITSKHVAADALVNAVLIAYAKRRENAVRSLCALFSGWDEAEIVLERRLKAHFRLANSR